LAVRVEAARRDCEEVAEGIIGMFRNATVERIEGDEYR